MQRSDKYGPWAVVTGASDGIGRALAHRAAAHGCNVVLAARSEAMLRELASELEHAHPVQTRVVSVDLGHSEGVSTLVDAVDDLDVGLAVLAAGFGSNQNFTDSDPEIQRDMIAVNVTAVAQLAQCFARRMAARGRGGLMLFGSILGWQGVPGQANYSATKAYVQALAEALHGELKPAGVDVLSVAPGPVATGFGSRAGLALSSPTTPEVVADAAWEALGRRVTVVPGRRAKFLTLTLATLPRQIRSVILGRAMKSMRA